MAITRDQLLIADLIGTVAILIATVPFAAMAIKELRSNPNDRENHSFASAVVKIYLVQLIISFMFHWFVLLWDSLVKKDDYKLLGSNGAFSVWWTKNYEAMANSAIDNPAMQGLWAYQGMIKVPFETFFSIIIMFLPIAAFLAATLRESQKKQGYREGSDIIKQSVKAVIYTFLSVMFMFAYIELVNFTIHHPVGILDIIHNWWNNIFFGVSK